MYSKKIILSVFLLAAAASLTAAQTPQRNMQDFGFIQHANPWLTSINAAGLGTLSTDRTSYAEAFFDKENGGVIPVEGSDDSWCAGIGTKSYVKISDKIAFHGELSYSYFHGRNMGGHYLIDPDYNPVNFLESTETTTGIKVKETYRLLGGMSYALSDRWSLGANISYETADYAKRKDPRTKSQWMDLDISAGARFAPSDRFSAGLDLQYVRTVETLDGDIFGTTNRQYFTFIDFGGYLGYVEAFDGTTGYINVGSSAARNARPMTNTFYGGSLQLTFGRPDNVLLFNELTYLRRSGLYGNRASIQVAYTEHFGNIYRYSGALNISRGKNLHIVELEAGYEDLMNYENIYRMNTIPGGNTVAEYFGQSETLNRSDITGKLSYTGYLGVEHYRPEWEYGLAFDATYRSFRSTYYPYYRMQEVTSMQAAVHGKKNFIFTRNMFEVGLNASYYGGFGTKSKDGSYAATASDNHSSASSYLDRDFEYDTAARVAGTLSFRYTRLFGSKISAYIDVSDTYNHTLKKPEFLADGWRNIFTVTIGCAF